MLITVLKSICKNGSLRVFAVHALSRVRVVVTEWSQSGQILRCDKVDRKLQALVYDIFPLTTAVFSYAIGSRKLSADEQFFVAAQTVVSLLQTTQIKQGVSVIDANKI